MYSIRESENTDEARAHMTGLSGRLCLLAAGGAVDEDAVQRREIDLAMLRKFGEAFRAGWLHNIMSRITPITARKVDDYVAMADIFVADKEAAARLMERYSTDLEGYCMSIGLEVTGHMSSDNVSPELEAHVGLYKKIAAVFKQKFDLESEDPIDLLTSCTNCDAETNPYLKEFVEQRFGDRKKK